MSFELGVPVPILGATHQPEDALLVPESAHAAVQLAVIDRAFGTPIVAERIGWLRELGARDGALLDELATPVTPLPGRRDHQIIEREAEDHVRIAELAEAARLAPLAARHWRAAQRPLDAQRAEAKTAEHLAQIRAVTSL